MRSKKKKKEKWRRNWISSLQRFPGSDDEGLEMKTTVLYSQFKGNWTVLCTPPPPLKSATHSTANICCFFFVLLFLNIHFNHSQISKTWFEIHTGCKFNHIKKTKNRKIQSAGKERQKQGKRLYCSWYHHLWFFFFSQILKSTGAFATNTTKSYLK